MHSLDEERYPRCDIIIGEQGGKGGHGLQSLLDNLKNVVSISFTLSHQIWHTSAFKSCIHASTIGISPANFFPILSLSKSFVLSSCLLPCPIFALSAILPNSSYAPTVPCHLPDLLPRCCDSTPTTALRQQVQINEKHANERTQRQYGKQRQVRTFELFDQVSVAVPALDRASIDDKRIFGRVIGLNPEYNCYQIKSRIPCLRPLSPFITAQPRRVPLKRSQFIVTVGIRRRGVPHAGVRVSRRRLNAPLHVTVGPIRTTHLTALTSHQRG